jgi:hypothetical protein
MFPITQHRQFRLALWAARRVVITLLASSLGLAQSASTSSSAKHGTHAVPTDKATIDPGTITNGIYRNNTLRLSCKIPAGWVLRTEEMNASDEPSSGPSLVSSSGSHAEVLLAAFSRPPEARGEDINGSILIAAELASSYPGLKEPIQYFGPITEIAKAQGFTADEEPYEIAVGAKNLVREDFHKDVGSRVLRQSTLAMLEHGYAISITVIGGTEDEVEGLIDGFQFGPSPRPAPPSK